MTPTRPSFWNIEGAFLIYVFTLVQLAIMGYGIYRHYRRWREGQPTLRFDHPRKRLRLVLTHAVAQGRLLRDRYSGVMHLAFSWGFALLFLGTVVATLDAELGIPIMRGDFYLWYQSLVLDLAGLAASVGLGMALWKRYVARAKRLREPPDRQDSFFDAFVPGALLAIVITGFLLEGLRIQATRDPWAVWSPVGYVVGAAFGAAGVNETTLRALHAILWWFHLALASTFVALLPYSKMMHLLTAPANIFFSSLEPAGALAPMDFEKAEKLGVAEPEQLTWKQLLDLDSCTTCGRCQEVCPAYAAGQPLSPKALILDLRQFVRYRGLAASAPGAGANDRDTATNAGNGQDLLPPMIGAITQEAVWSCVTCRACMGECPVFVEHVPTIVDVRRYLVMESADYPEQLQQAMKNLEARGTPYRGVKFSRTDWCRDLGVKELGSGGGAEYLYWVGCTAAFDERSQKVARAFARLLQRSGVEFAILGEEESCCGDPARRAGNEFLFDGCARGNVELLKGYGVAKIVTTCPHCFNSLKNEYPQLGGSYQVIHHTELLGRLVTEGRLKPTVPLGELATFHDSCYLGRYNGRYEEPRALLRAIPGVQLAEMERSRDRSFCCGAGGGHMWMEEISGGRINHSRADQVLSTGASTVATACPFCTVMLEDGVRARAGDRVVRVADVGELLEEVTRPTHSPATARG